MKRRRVLATDANELDPYSKRLGWEKKDYPFREGYGPYRICDIEILSEYPGDGGSALNILEYNNYNHAYYRYFHEWRRMIDGS